jgi:hypothetical protein
MRSHGVSSDPSYLHRTGSCFAPLWAAQCLGCGDRLTWHRLISTAMAELDEHQRMHKVRALESLTSRHRDVRADRRGAYYQIRDAGRSTDSAALMVGVNLTVGQRWDAERAKDVA